MRITVVAHHRNWPLLTPLLDAYERKGYAVELLPLPNERPPIALLQTLVKQSNALLLIGPPRCAPRTVLPGPVLKRADGVAIPVGWLPDTTADKLARFVETAVQLHQRPALPQSIAVLAQWQPRYLTLAARIEQSLLQPEKAIFHWSSDRLVREEMVRGMRAGLGVAIYVGHGRPIGWVGYHGTRLHHFTATPGEPLGALLSLCCATASHRRTSLSFAEALPLHGIAGAAFGAVANTLHINNTRWAVNLCRALCAGVATIGELIVAALPTSEQAVNDYRLLGDPLAPLRGAVDGIAKAQTIELFP